MAEEGERVGGIYVDVGIQDEGVITRLNEIAEAMSALAKRETTVKVKLVEEGSTTPQRAQGKKSVLPAAFELEKDAAKKAVKNVEAVSIPVTLALANDAISKLQAQINEAFQNFTVKVNVQYGGGASPSAAQDEFAEATGLGGGGQTRTKRVTRSSGPAQRTEAPAFDRFHAVVRNVAALDIAKQTLAELKKSSTTSQSTLNKLSGFITKAERNVSRFSYTPAGSLPEENREEVVERPLIERERRAYRHDPRQAKRALPAPEERAVLAERRAADIEQRTGFAWPTTRAAQRVPPTPAAPIGPRPGLEPLAPLTAPRRAGRQQGMLYDPQSEFTSVGKANLGYEVPRINIIPGRREFYEAQEQAQSRAARAQALLAGRRAGETGGGGFAPRVGPVREFDRTPLAEVEGARGAVAPGPAVAIEGVQAGEGLVIRGPRQRGPSFRQSRYATRRTGPERTYAQDPAAGRRGPGFFEPRPANAVARSEDALRALDPAIYDKVFALLEQYRKGEFGTPEEPMVEELNQEGRRVGPIRPLTDQQRRKALKDAESTAYGTTFSAGRYRIVNPKAIFKEQYQQIGQVPGPIERRVFGRGGERGTLPEEERVGLLGLPRFRPDAGIVNAGGGYVNTAGGPGGAVRSVLDTPEGNAASRKLIEEQRAAERAAEQEDIDQERALMRVSPREFSFNQTQLTDAFKRFEEGYAERTGLENYLPAEQEATPASVYRASVSKFLDEFKAEFGYKKGAKLESLPIGISGLVQAQAAKVREATGFSVKDYDRINATGGAGKRFIPGTIEEAAARAEPPGRATTTARERRRDYTPAENQVAEIRSRLERLEGTPEQIRTAVKRGSVTEDMQYIPGSPGTAEEQRQARRGGATQVERGRLGEIDVSRLLLAEVQARGKRQTKAADRIRGVLAGDIFEEDPRKIRDLTKKIRGLGIDIPEGSGLPGGAMAGIDITPAANIKEARSRLAKALVLRRGYRRMLRPSYAAADAERRADQERIEQGFREREAAGLPVDRGTGPILLDKPLPIGDEIREKVGASAIVGRRVSGIVKSAAYEPIKPPEGPRPPIEAGVEEFIARSQAQRGLVPRMFGEQLSMFGPAPEVQARRAAEDNEERLVGTSGPGGRGGGAGPGGPGAGLGFELQPPAEGPIPVEIVASIPLTIEGGVKVAGGESGKASAVRRLRESGDDIDPEKISAAAGEIRKKLPDISDKDLAKILQGRGYEPVAVRESIGLAPPTERGRAQSLRTVLAEAQAANPGLQLVSDEQPKDYKSDARIKAEAEILQARAQSPTRAFQTAVAAAFAKTLGGGGKFEVRVKELTRALNVQADFEEALEKTTHSLDVNRINLDNIARQTAEITASPRPTDKAGIRERTEKLSSLQAAEQGLQARRGELEKTKAGLEPQVNQARQETESRRRSLISPVGVVRGFAALGVGAITGGLIFSAASQAIQGALGAIEEQASKAADALGGFAITASKVAAELASAIRASFGDTRGAVAGQVAPSGISAAALQTLTGQGLAGRAEAIAAAQARVQESDLIRSGQYLGQNRQGGFDRSLFEGTGGVLNTALFAPQPGFLERLTADLKPPTATSNLKFSNPVADLLGAIGLIPPEGTGPFIPGTDIGSIGPSPDALEQRAKTNQLIVDDLNKQLERVTSSFEVLNNAPQPVIDAMVESAASISDAAKKQAENFAKAGVAITGPGGAALAGKQFGTAAEELARGQLTVDKEVAFEQDKRGLQAQINQIYRQRDYALQESIPRQLSLEALAAPAMPVGTGIAPEDRSSVAADLKEANALQTQLNQRYAEGTQLLKDAIPKDLYDSIESTGKAIADIQTTISNAQAALQVHEYNNQLFIAKRTYTDILGLQGKSVHQGASHLGVLERQNVELSRQSEALQRMLQQRQINFQLATAGFIVAGQSPEERAARIKDAKTQAEFAQKQLDISTKAAKNNIRIFDLQNINSARDALAAIGLLKEGRQVTIQTKAAEEKLQRLNKLQADNVKRAGKFIEAVEGEAAIAQSEIYKLEVTYGKAIDSITRQTIQGFIKTARAIAANMPFVGGEQNGTDRVTMQYSGQRNASGFLGTVSGATNMIMGEAGTETVAILRNARTITATGGGGGGVIININGPVVREDSDIQKITRAVINALNTRTALLGLR